MTDRELLEAAAKAIGYKVAWEGGCTTGWMANGRGWNPLTDDGDALRLAVKLGISLDTALGQSLAIVVNQKQDKDCVERHGSDPYAATRRAIVRAAAAMGASA